MDIEKFKRELKQFIGTTKYYRGFLGILFTEGVHYLCEKCECYWLTDLIASYQGTLKDLPFQVWKIVVNEDQTAIVTCRRDSNEEPVVEQHLEFTDFPLPEYELWKIENVILLKSEY